jgi:Tfp pilus assembly protein PilE
MLAILMSLAAPSYKAFSQRSQRIVAITELLQVASCQERTKAISGHYNTSICLPKRNFHYSYTYATPELSKSDKFTVIAQPIGAQLHDKCDWISLDHDGHRQVGNKARDIGQCWRGR